MNRLRELRKEQELTLRKLGNIINTSNQNISNWEVGRSNPNIKYLIVLADYFNVSIDYLVGRSDVR
ncbi:XRE family transcriptional regulator [Leuconostoc falkenbergense]|uniref:XRE family transcriptional regulator n=1 Tax=Leuconostoc falkenbergense TaxID=2766470 RepID=A0A9X3IQA1_9LACO|nr:helix-turn-helix transcriptional regulator [Leuconostoc falkenbergense]MCX7579292.1 XRE family transcriptional regulator [Leuconostoc falkenbergense]